MSASQLLNDFPPPPLPHRRSHHLLPALNVGSTSVQTKEAMGMLLQACGQRKDIETGRKLHEIVSKSTQYSNDLVIGTRLITMYALCGFPLDSRFVFDDLVGRNLVQWNALISAYTKNELYDDAVNVFMDLIWGSEFRPDNFTFPCAIKACGGLLEVGLGEAIQGMVMKMGLGSDVFVGNALIAMYGKCGFVEEAAKLFDYMPNRNLVSWNSMIFVFSENGFSQQSFDKFVEMLGSGFLPDIATMVTILPVCAHELVVDLGTEVHGLAVKLGLSEELTVNNAMIDMYSKCGFLSKAQVLFDRNNKRNVVSWNTMIRSFSMQGYVHGTFNLLQKMQMKEGEMKANEVTILNALPVCSEKSQLRSLRELHGYSYRHRFMGNGLVANGFVAAYARCGSLDSAECVFKGIETKNVNSWNAFIGGCAQNGNPRKALDSYIQMKSFGLEPDWFSISSLLLACAHLKSLRYGKGIHAFILRNELETDSFIAISLISLYARCGKPYSARLLFDGLEEKSLVSWNAMIAGYSQNELPYDALFLFRKLLSTPIQPCKTTITSVLSACSQRWALRLGKEAHCYALKALLTEDIFVGCATIDMYAKCGCIKESRRVFDRLREKNVASWNAIISAYAVHGDGKEALKLAEKMKVVGQAPDEFTFIGILMACNHAGMVEEGLEYFKQMKNSYGIEPRLEHYACVIDMMGRAGQLENCMRIVEEMPMEADAGIWSSLLSSCRSYGAVEMGEKVAEKLLELEPHKAENHVLLSNLYAGAGQWDGVRRVRQLMKEIGLLKDAGCSWIEIEGKAYGFTAGDNL